MSAIDYRCAGRIATLTLNKPERHNAFDDGMIADLRVRLATIQDDDDIRLVILQAAGKSFSAGADLDWMRRMADYSEEENYRDASDLSQLFHELATLAKPTVCLVQGAAIGGGVGLVAACDIALGSPAAFFALSEVKLGLVPAVVSPYINMAMGERSARRYFLTGERFDAETARRLGLLHGIEDDLAEAGAKIADSLLENGPLAMACIKKKLSSFGGQAHRKVMDDTARIIAALRVSPEGREGISAFLEKRKPTWVIEDDR